MPQTTVLFYREDHAVPALDWLDQQSPAAQARCTDAIHQLATYGHELRRPHTDYLQDGIYELRVRVVNVQYRLLYFFSGPSLVIVAHALTKERAVPAEDIQRALRRKDRFERDPSDRTAEVEL
jgi:phage-related protein